PVNNNLFKYYGRTGSISGSTIAFQPSFAVSNTPSLPEFGRDAVVNSVYMGDYNTAFATGGAFHVSWSDNRDDLPGGAPRKDPNVYYVSFNIAVGPVITPAGSSIVDEGCPPSNGAVDPGERVTMNLRLMNVGSGSTTNLVATLQSSANV